MDTLVVSRKEAAKELRIIAHQMKDSDNWLMDELADQIYNIAEKLDDDK